MVESKLMHNFTFLGNLELFFLFLFALQFDFPYSVNSLCLYSHNWLREPKPQTSIIFISKLLPHNKQIHTFSGIQQKHLSLMSVGHIGLIEQL